MGRGQVSVAEAVLSVAAAPVEPCDPELRLGPSATPSPARRAAGASPVATARLPPAARRCRWPRMHACIMREAHSTCPCSEPQLGHQHADCLSLCCPGHPRDACGCRPSLVRYICLPPRMLTTRVPCRAMGLSRSPGMGPGAWGGASTMPTSSRPAGAACPHGQRGRGGGATPVDMCHRRIRSRSGGRPWACRCTWWRAKRRPAPVVAHTGAPVARHACSATAVRVGTQRCKLAFLNAPTELLHNSRPNRQGASTWPNSAAVPGPRRQPQRR